jgi:short-subunit dehydrogenase
MLEAAKRDAGYEGHVVNTASMAGLLAPPTMGVYNVSKHAVVALTETMYQDLALVTDRVHCSLLCPYFVPTGISRSERNRGDAPGNLTLSQRVSQAMTDKAVSSSKVTAAQVAQIVFDAVRARRFYIYSHPKALKGVQTRMEDVLQQRNPTDPYAERPEVSAALRQQLRPQA